MGCNSDYLEPTYREAELQRAAGLLVFVTKSLGNKPEDWMKNEAGNLYASDDRSVTELCAVLKAMSKEDLERIVYDAKNKTARDLADWWETHQAADTAREAKEKAAAKAEAIRKKAVAKLTPKERKVLGV
jgi:hypothetical protein